MQVSNQYSTLGSEVVTLASSTFTRSEHPHGHLPVEAGALIGETKHRPGNCFFVQGSIVQINFFEYEMSRGLQVLSEC